MRWGGKKSPNSNKPPEQENVLKGEQPTWYLKTTECTCMSFAKPT